MSERYTINPNIISAPAQISGARSLHYSTPIIADPSSIATSMYTNSQRVNSLGIGIQIRKDKDQLKKLFVKNIPPDIPDNFMEALFRECGPIYSFRRTKDEKDIPLTFGYVDFETTEALLKCIRIIEGLNLKGYKLSLKPSNKTEAFIKQWTEIKKRDYETSNSTKDSRVNFEDWLRREDKELSRRIRSLADTFDLDRLRDEKAKEVERKEHPRERERDHRKRMYAKELERKFRDKMNEWMRHEGDKDREYRREEFLKREIKREKQRILDKELHLEISTDKLQRTLERKKARQRENEDDAIDKRKELQELGILPPEPEIISPPSDDEGKGYDEMKTKNHKLIAEEDPTNTETNFNLMSKSEYIAELKAQHKKEESLPFEILPESSIPNPRELFEKGKADAEEKEANEQKELKIKLQSILAMIPSKQSELFDFPLNWSLLATSGLIDKKVKPWLSQKSVEYLGLDEPIFVNAILKKLANNVNGREMVKKAAKVIDDDAEEFVVKLWRMLIFETKKMELSK